jgi:23S rRNA pseudouridine1911/1915/1917 synthase
MTAPQQLTVGVRGARQRLDRYLTALGRWGSRSQVQRLIEGGHVRVDDQPAKAGAVLRSGQTIVVEPAPPPPLPAGVEAEAIPLSVLYEDDWLLVINKPPGLVVHPAPGHWRGTLVSALLHHWRGPRSGLDPMRPGIVHRLDKDTSGVLVIAKDAATLADLGAQFRAREVEKQYVAFVWGRLRPQTGTISEPIGRNPTHRKRMAVRHGGREAITAFAVCEHLDGVTMLRLFPKTGRTHQIRVHLAAIGHPIVGDAVYGRSRTRSSAALIQRQALHAERLTLRHPQTGARVSFTAPLTDDLVVLRQRCAAAARTAVTRATRAPAA